MKLFPRSKKKNYILIQLKEVEELMMKIVVLTSLLYFLFGISYACTVIIIILQCYTDLQGC